MPFLAKAQSHRTQREFLIRILWARQNRMQCKAKQMVSTDCIWAGSISFYSDALECFIFVTVAVRVTHLRTANLDMRIDEYKLTI